MSCSDREVLQDQYCKLPHDWWHFPKKRSEFCRKRQEAEAQAEALEMATGLKTNIEEGDIYQLPEEGEEEEGTAPDLPAVLRRIREVARVLDNFKLLRDASRSRSEYLDQVHISIKSLSRILAAYSFQQQDQKCVCARK